MPVTTRSVAKRDRDGTQRKPCVCIFDVLSVDTVADILVYLDTKHVARFMLSSHVAIDAGRQSLYRTQIFNRRTDVRCAEAVAMASNRRFCTPEQRVLRERQTTYLTSSGKTNQRVEYQLENSHHERLWNFEWWTGESVESSWSTDPSGAAGKAEAVQAKNPSAKALWMLFSADHRNGGPRWYQFEDAV